MSSNKQHTRRKWVIIPLQITGQGMYDIDFRMPANVDRCEGLMLSVVQRISDRDLQRIGELSMEVNARKVHPVHLMLDYLANSLAPKKEPLLLEEPLQQCSHIGGYYRDYTGENYTLNIYLACRTKPTMQ